MKVNTYSEFLELYEPFRVSFGAVSGMDVIRVEITNGQIAGRGECCPMQIYDQSIEQTLDDIGGVIPAIESGDLGRQGLQDALPAAPARNALDCALWDLEAKSKGASIWELLGIDRQDKIAADVSIGLASPEEMAAKARVLGNTEMVKLKLGGDEDVECVRAVRDAMPATRMYVDVNCGWTIEQLNEYSAALKEAGVFMIEQPLAIGSDAEIANYTGDIALCADESCHDRADLDELVGLYQYVNIKLDKTGGLTEALAVSSLAKTKGFRLMVGSMAGSCLAMAPAFVLATRCEIVDLDVVRFIKSKEPHEMLHDGAFLHGFTSELWG